MFSYIQYLFVRGLVTALQAVPYESARRLGRGLAKTLYRLDRGRAQKTIETLRQAYGDTRNGEWLKNTAAASFEQLGKHVAVALHVPRRADLEPVWENPEVLREAHKLGKGVVLISGHFGSWVVLGHVPKKFDIPSTVIFKRQKNIHLLRWTFRFMKEQFGITGVEKQNAADVVEGMLRRGDLVAFFADQRPSGGGFPGTYFGQEVNIAAGPAIYAKRCKSPMVLCTVHQRADGRHVARFEGPISTEGKLRDITQRWADALEARIREHPDQYMWMHRRFRD